jgi:hypothetical protein
MEAYIISLSNGTVQIGDTIFQPSTGKTFPVQGNEAHKYAPVKVSGASMDEARRALAECLKNG